MIVQTNGVAGSEPPYQVPEMSQQPRTKGIELYTALIANKLSAEQFVDEYAAETERTLERAGYYKK